MDITLPSSAPSSLPLSRSPLSSIQDVEAATASILALSDSLFQMEPMSVGQILHSLWSCSRDHLCILALSDVAFKNSDLDLLSSFTSLASFQLNGRNCSLNDEGMEKLTMCSSLTHLTLSECLYITGSGMKYLSPSCADITFQLCRNINDGAIWKLVTTQKQLHTLTIDQCPITDQGIAFLTQAKKLKSLSITGTKSKKTIINIAALPSSSSSSPNNIAVAINPPPPQVIHHHTITPLLSDDALYWISNTSITLLQLRSCDSMSGSALLYHFRRSHMGNLRKLRVDDCPFITQQNCEHVKQVITLLYNGKVIVKKTQQDMELETKEQELEEKENYSANFSSSSLSSSLVSDLGCIGSASLCSGDHRVGGSLPISEYYYSCYDCDLLLTHHHPVCTYCLPLHGEHRTTKFPVKAKQICACFQECCDQRHSLKASFSPL